MAVSTPWALVLAEVLAGRDDSRGVVAVVNPWIRVMAGVLARRGDGVLWCAGWSSCMQGFWGALAVVH